MYHSPSQNIDAIIDLAFEDSDFFDIDLDDLINEAYNDAVEEFFLMDEDHIGEPGYFA